MHYRLLLTFIFCALIPFASTGQPCGAGESEVIIEIVPDNYPQETSWELADAAGNILATGETIGDTVCLDSTLCLLFTIYDTYGDGICCGFGQGSYTVYYNAELVGTGGDFEYNESISFNCPPGFSCVNPVVIDPGSYVAPNDNYWYEFTPDSTGIYTITTCSLNTCDTKLWIYDLCAGINVSEDNAGAIYYDDNEGGCGNQAQITAYLEATEIYYIRIGSTMGDCAGAILWELIFGGEIYGCMDSNSCNFNPLATVEDGSCLPQGHPDCGGGPDLWVLESAIRSSLHADVVNNTNDNCLIEEGCVQGFGARQVVRFTTHIKNIGDMDYYIGDPQDQPGQFSFDNCHGHYHYEGYAEYRVYNDQNQLQPIGFKNGFCVIDLECNDGGTPKYGCGNMGISSLCGDFYSSGLQCQWIDVTDLPDGDYTFVTTVNWDQSPDALGNYELRYDNNWAQVCFNLSRTGDIHTVAILDPCEVVEDCEGTPFGNVVEDCAGICGGLNLYGDVNGDFLQNTTDAESYVFDIINGGLDAHPCYDLNSDGVITVFDATLVNDCFLYGSTHQHPGGGNIHDHCNLPGGVVNPTHLASLSIIDYNPSNSTIDIGLRNPQDHINAYEFNMSGMEIISVISLVDPNVYPETPQYEVGGNKIISISVNDSIIPKSDGSFQPICRIQFTPDNSGVVCIEEIIDLVNYDNHKVNSSIEDGCVNVNIVSSAHDQLPGHNINVFPNPGTGLFSARYKLVEMEDVVITIMDHMGRKISGGTIRNSTEGIHLMDLTNEADGIYNIYFQSATGASSTRVLKVE